MTPAERWSADLRRAQTFRGVSNRKLAAAAGVSKRAVDAWRAGRMPRMEVAVRVADVLDWGSLLEAVRQHRERACEACGGPMMATGYGPERRWCGDRCGSRAWHREQRESESTRELAVLRLAVTEHREAVAEMCRRCTLGEGTCWDGTCALRDVSPLPLARRNAA